MCGRSSGFQLGRPWRSGWVRGAAFSALSLSLAAQGLPEIPDTPRIEDIPDMADLLPYRPRPLDASQKGTEPLQYRGEKVSNGPAGWVIENGALQGKDMVLFADLINYDPRTGFLSAKGHIRVDGQNLRLRCERLEMDWVKRDGEAWAIQLEVDPDWNIEAAHVAFSGMRRWDFKTVKVASCPQEEPGWFARMSRLKLDLDAFATFQNARLSVESVPVMYIPWGAYPVKKKRSSGLLPTLPGHSSDLGFTLALPYFQTLGDTMDLTFQPEFHTQENPLWQADFRWNPETTHEGQVSGQYIREKKDREDRYRFSIKERWQREDGWRASADINQASDSLMEADYGHDVEGLGGFSFDSSVYLGRDFSKGSLGLFATERRSFFHKQNDPYFQQEFPTSLRKLALPEIQGRLFPRKWGRFYFDAGARLGHFSYRLETPNHSYSWLRGDAFVRMQGSLGQWGPFRADLETMGRFTNYSASLRHPLYDTTTTQKDGEALNPQFNPFIVDAGSVQRAMLSGQLTVAGPSLGRVFDRFRLFSYQRQLKHVIEPFVTVTGNTRTRDESRIPRFDDVDSWPGVGNSAMGERSIEFGVKQHVFGRLNPGETYLDLLRWKVSTKYYFDPVLLADGVFRQGWATIDSVLDLDPAPGVKIGLRNTLGVKRHYMDSSISIDLSSQAGNRFRFAYYVTDPGSGLKRQQGVQVSGLQRFMDDRFRVEYFVNHNFKQLVAARVALAIVRPCVAASIRFSHVAVLNAKRENRVEFVFSLRNLGDFSLFNR